MTTATTRPAPRIVAHRPETPAPAALAARPARVSRTPITARIARVVVLSIGSRSLAPSASLGWLGRARILDDHDGRAVGDDLRHRAGQLGAVEAHRDDRVGAHQGRVLDQPIEGLPAGVLEQRRVLLDLAATDRAKAGDQVAREAATPDDDPEGLAFRLRDAVSGDERGRGDDHDWCSLAWRASWVIAGSRLLRRAQHSPHGQRSRSRAKV